MHAELTIAFVVLKPGVDVTAEELTQYANGDF